MPDTLCGILKKRANAQIAHLQFAQANTQSKIAKELFINAY